MEKGLSCLEGKTILAVDDFEKWLNVVKSNAEYYGAREKDLFFAQDIKEGDRIYVLEKPDIVISDINFDKNDLRDIQGLEWIGHLREREYFRTGKIKQVISAMSSLEEDIKLRALALGANYFINKREFSSDFDGFIEWYKKR